MNELDKEFNKYEHLKNKKFIHINGVLKVEVYDIFLSRTIDKQHDNIYNICVGVFIDFDKNRPDVYPIDSFFSQFKEIDDTI